MTTGSLEPFVQGRGSLISGDPGGFQITTTVDSFPSRKLPCLLRFNMSGIRSKQERKMAIQNPNRLRTNCPGGSLTLGGDTTVNRLGFGAMRLCGSLVYGVNRLIVRVLSAC